MAKRNIIIGKSNRNAPVIYRAYNCYDHLFPYELIDSNIVISPVKLAVALEAFNSLTTIKLNLSPNHKYSSEDLFEIYKSMINPEKSLQKSLINSSESREIKIEISPDEKQVYLCRNYIIELSENICKLDKITVFQTCCNYIRYLPYNIGHLKNLKMLILSRNRIVSIPDEIGQCLELREIDVSFNCLSGLPISMMSLKKLNTLQLAGNKFKEIPIFIGKLTSLKYLNVACNSIENIPLEVFKLPFLLSLTADQCNFNKKTKFEIVGEMSLQEISSRRIISSNMPVPTSICKKLRNHLIGVQECSFCGGPMLDTYVEVEDFHIFESETYPVKYRMCCLHYNKHSDRLSTLFERSIGTYPSKLIQETGLSVTELFVSQCYTETNNKVLREKINLKTGLMPLIMLSQYNNYENKRFTIERFIEENQENWNTFD